MAEIVWAREAVQWLEEIFEHIAADNPHAATAVTSGIFERAHIFGTAARWAAVFASVSSSEFDGERFSERCR